MATLPEYFIGKGDVKLAKLDVNGNPLAFSDRGETAVLEFDLITQYADNFRTGKTGPNEQDLHVPIKRELSVTLTLKETTDANLADFLHGTATPEVAGSYTAAGAFPTGILVGETYLIPGGHNGLSSVIIKDSAGTPATLVNGTDYTVNADAGLITFLNLGSYVQPFKAFSYGYKAASGVSVMAQTPAEYCLVYDGINLAVPGEKTFVRIDRVAFMPAAKISMKCDAVNDYELKGVALLGVGKTQSDGFGTYRRF
jgi:hypothetical protein